MTIGELLRRGREWLAAAGVESPRLDAEVLLMELLGVDRAHLYLRLPDPAAEPLQQAYDELLMRRVSDEPVAYITGHREFMGLDFLVDPRVLIPRPETERLVEWALERLQASGAGHIVDVGTGSGAIAVSVAHYIPEDLAYSIQIVASDTSLDALQVAAANAERLAPGHVEFVCGDLLSWDRGKIDLLLANLPYLRDDQRHSGIAMEPASALYAPSQGFALYEALLPQARALLAPGGAIGCEIDPGQRERALRLASDLFPGAQVTVEPDLAGLDRYLFVETPR